MRRLNYYSMSPETYDEMSPHFYNLRRIFDNLSPVEEYSTSRKRQREQRQKQIELEENKLIEQIPNSEIEHAARNNLSLDKFTVKRLRLFVKSLGYEPKVYNQSKHALMGLVASLYTSVEKISGESTCPICFDDHVQLQILNPCGHGVCSLCSRQLKNCHTCRADIKSVIRPFI